MHDTRVFLGTCGFTYNHWKPVFYPLHLPKSKWFEYYAKWFNSVEINASFHRIPTIKTVQGWERRAPQDFCFAVKMSRLITHVRKLKNCEKEINWYFSVFEPLRKKIGAVLIQLPPTMKYNPDRLHTFFHFLPKIYHFAFEFRNREWYREETYQLLKDNDYSFCIHDMGELKTDRIITSDTVYVRFHGFDSLYGGNYRIEILENWAKWIRECVKSGKTVFAFFNNDIGGFAVKNCLTLKKLVDGI
ncbi:MAG: DUF72 domain-containing protein [Fibrobacter sp.]|nr:DUF72 domain-containing protein [Fibrobacter sp.]